jgi:hypothetical protein
MYDGINLQSGPYFFGVYSYFLYQFGFNSFFLMILIVLSIFCLLNAKGKIFFGNSGVYLISFITSYIMIKQYNNFSLISIEEIFLIMCIPGYDMLRLFFSRLYQMRSPFSSDSNHIHHIILRKVKFIWTYFIIQIILIIPYLMYLFIDSFFYSFIISVVIYFYIIRYFSKNNYNQ